MALIDVSELESLLSRPTKISKLIQRALERKPTNQCCSPTFVFIFVTYVIVEMRNTFHFLGASSLLVKALAQDFTQLSHATPQCAVSRPLF